MKKTILILSVCTGWAFGDQCQITSPLPMPVTINGCTFSSSLPNNSTSYIQNTLSPTTTTQMFSVQTSSISGGETLGFLTGTQCLQEVNGVVSGTTCGSGGGGGSSSLQVTQSGVQITSPTASINFLGPPFLLTAIGGTTSQVALDPSSVTLLGQGVLTTSSATSTYFNVNNILGVAQGGTGTSSPGLIPGTNITSITGSWPNQTINAATQGGGGGASSLAVSLGSSVTLVTQVSSPTAVVSFDMSQFGGLLLPNTTGFISIAYSTHAVTTSYTATSTDTVVEANCASACTITLPTANTTSGKRYNVKIIGAGTTTIAFTGGQTADGSATVTPNPNQWADIELESNGSNYEIL